MEENKENQPANIEQPAPPIEAPKPSVVTAPESVEEEVEAEEVEEKPGFSLPSPKFSFDFKSIPAKIINTLREFRRVIIVSRKPDMEEISKISKIAGLGIAIMGLLGFAIQIAFQLAIHGGV